MAKRKHSADWMLARVREYLSGKGSYRQIARANGISERSLRDWVRKYEEQDEASFMERAGNASYSKEFKASCHRPIRPFLQLRTFSETIWSKDANGSSYDSSEREDPGTVPDYREQTDSKIQSEIRGITKCRKSHADAKIPTWNLRL